MTDAPIPVARHDGTSVAKQVRRWRAAFFLCYGLWQLAKLLLAMRLPAIPDEAFYWQESRHLAWGYSDLPGMTAWLIRLGSTVGGGSDLAMRWPFLLLGAGLPWLVIDIGRYLGGSLRAWQAGLWCLALPFAASLGVLALPDVPLTVAIMVAICALLRLDRVAGNGVWWGLGVALAIAAASHYRAAPLACVVLILGLSAARHGVCWWRQPGAWWACGLGLLGTLPLWLSNLANHGAGLSFQLWQRNPWRFHADALRQPLEQAMVTGPLLYGLLGWVAWQAWRRRAQAWGWRVLASHALVFWLGYAGLGLFADASRFRLHWPLPGYLPLLAGLPLLLAEQAGRRWLRWLAGLAWGVGMSLGWLACGLLLATAWGRMSAHWAAALQPFTGWHEAASVAAQVRLPRQPVVADNFILAAELAKSDPRLGPVYSMDSMLNVRHGRAPQLAAWGLDRAGLLRQPGLAEVVLVVDENALRERWRWPALEYLCGELASLRPLARLQLQRGQRRFGYYAVRLWPVAHHLQPARCLLWWQAHQAVYPNTVPGA